MTNLTTIKNITINSNCPSFNLDVYHLAKTFLPAEQTSITILQNQNQGLVETSVTVSSLGAEVKKSQQNTINNGNMGQEFKQKLLKRFVKQTVYKGLKQLTGKSLEWGILTGIRPTQLAREIIKHENVDISLIKEYLIKHFYVSEKKASLVYQTLKNQKTIIRNNNLINLYINIPICPSRCSYCSFISSELSDCKHLINDYLTALETEIEHTKKLIFEKAYIVRSVYIGGGTPSVLEAEQLDKLLSLITYPVSEFTVECGRADTITDEKLAVLKKHGVTRISINPQTFVQKTLKTIGRTHTNKQVFEAYMLALKHDFIVNMDFIAGLEGESFSNFKKTINTALELSPHNITVHSLFLKTSSQLAQQTQLLQQSEQVNKMIDYSYTALTQSGYKPYYLYRQKNQSGGLENIGYALDGKVSLFNIDTMEETLSVIACGAGAISKKVDTYSKEIVRQQNPKFLSDYIKDINQVLEKKQIFV